ncbi:Stk1 family PASTA domain-containing Ser/Thr kinase [Nocardioides sp. AX2bis]|uniref:Stk1 family PASTA domain-containing Ser/Thr kinase n=1 Tax=Nocardioides sp. AX2bis TaxID=2653157 RepID=UPI0012F1A5F7|nr:Stk1 family PASTA domain-containing Ser/Thr kinase [Nocardioides sp. AX2bis]VXC41854.1 Serine/threonine-protein kinase PknB [Nocardioides sp. AX2bis]
MSDAGPLIGGRYQLGELLGRGGMAEVRKGTDSRLGRTVAVKRLRTDLASDDTFQARFRREAQSSASLNHPSIVAVYDTGEEIAADGVAQPYIVMELVSGRTLRDILREGRKILPERALEIASGVLAALDYSHRAGIIHRDIKPGNVMLTPSGDVKVMDFGIARAISDAQSTMTQTAAVVGTAQYLSPEQARGETVDSRSDVYSAGCLLYELLTSRPPFVGDSPVAVAYQHVREPAQPPSDHDTELPPEVDAIVMRSLAKRVEDRYQSAAEMRADIERYLAGEQVHARVPAGPVAGAAALGAAGAAAAGGAAYGAGGGTGATTAVPATPPDPEAGRRRGRGLMWLLVLLAVLLLAGAAFLLPRLMESPPERDPVPDLVRLSEEDARAAIGEAGLSVGEVEFRPDARIAAGRVVEQTPDPETLVVAATEVDLVVSEGPEQVEVPTVVGQQRPAAVAVLRDQGLEVDPVSAESDEPAGEVLSTDPGAGTSVDVGTRVTVTYSDGPEEVPAVEDLLQGEAVRQLLAAGFNPVVREDPSEVEPAGTVVDQIPDAGTPLAEGGDVNIFVSQGEPEPSEDPSEDPSESPSDDPSQEPSDGPTDDESSDDPSDDQTGQGGQGGNGPRGQASGPGAATLPGTLSPAARRS